MCAPLCWFMKNKNNKQFAVKIITELTLRRHVINIKCVSARFTQSSYRYRYSYSNNYTWLPRAAATKANVALITRAAHMWYVSIRYNGNASYTLHETRSWIFPSHSLLHPSFPHSLHRFMTVDQIWLTQILVSCPRFFFLCFVFLVYRALLMTFSFIVLWLSLVFLTLGPAPINWTARELSVSPVEPSKVALRGLTMLALVPDTNVSLSLCGAAQVRYT